MKKGKLLMLICSIFFLSGCSVDYNVSISKDYVDETVVTKGIPYDTFPIPAHISDQGASEQDVKIEGVEYYDISKNENEYEYTYKYKFSFDKYPESTAVNTCLKALHIIKKEDGNYFLSTTANYNCMKTYSLIDNINVKIDFNNNDFEVLESNADSYSESSYIWYVNKDNYDNKIINVLFSEKNKVEEKEPVNNDENKKEENKNELPSWVKENTALLVVGCFILLIAVIFGVIVIKKKF